MSLIEEDSLENKDLRGTRVDFKPAKTQFESLVEVRRTILSYLDFPGPEDSKMVTQNQSRQEK